VLVISSGLGKGKKVRFKDWTRAIKKKGGKRGVIKEGMPKGSRGGVTTEATWDGNHLMKIESGTGWVKIKKDRDGKETHAPKKKKDGGTERGITAERKYK